MRGHRLLPGVQLGGVADPLLALEDLGQLRLLGRGPEGDVARAVVVERLGVGLPDLDARRHQLRHRRLEVVVADHPAGDPRGAGADRGLLQDERLLAGLGQVPGGGEAVHPGADDQVGSGFGELRHLVLRRLPALEHRRPPVPPTIAEPSTQGPSSGWGNLAWARLRRMP